MQSIKFENIIKMDFQTHEAFNLLRANILFCGKDIKTICITSCSPDEGKSSVSYRLAMSLAEDGKKVLFIDADLRKSVMVGRLKVDQAVYGLTHYLSGMKTLDEVLNQTNIENFDVILAGPVPPNPSELLGSDICKNLIQTKRKEYDYIIIDTPPLGLVVDSASVAEHCDGAILVVESKKVSYKLAQQVVKQLERGNCKLLGVILNKVIMKNKSYYGKYYHKYSGQYYGFEDER
jgi:capsular exopolysaccharide synthesis family protein